MEICFQKLRRSVKEMLDEFRVASGKKVDYEFINPSTGKDAKTGIISTGTFQERTQSGKYQAKDNEAERARKLYSLHDRELQWDRVPINFLSNNNSLSFEQIC